MQCGDGIVANVGDIVVARYLYNKTVQFGIVDKYMPKSNRWKIVFLGAVQAEHRWEGFWHYWKIFPDPNCRGKRV